MNTANDKPITTESSPESTSHPFLNAAFLRTMNELGEYGVTKYGPLPADRDQHVAPDRVGPFTLAVHATDHFAAYLAHEPHDHFSTRRHQLAAVAYNAMMEFHFAGLENEQ